MELTVGLDLRCWLLANDMVDDYLGIRGRLCGIGLGGFPFFGFFVDWVVCTALLDYARK